MTLQALLPRMLLGNPELSKGDQPLGKIIIPRGDRGVPTGPISYEITTGGRYWSRELKTSVSGLRLLNPPIALAELLEEVNHVTPKQVFFLDSRPFLGGDLPYAVNSIDTGSNADIIPVSLNPIRATAETVGHELMHAWIEFFLGLEDHRTYFDQRDHPMLMMTNIIQSMVLDCTVLWQLKKRGGFDCDQFRRDLVAAAVASIAPYKYGLMHGSEYGQLVAAEALAVPHALPELYELDANDKKTVEDLWQVCRTHDPALAWVAERFADALRTHGYETADGIRKAIDTCLFAAYEFMGKKYDPDKHMVIRKGVVRWLDKMPTFLTGMHFCGKMDVISISVQHRQHVKWRFVPPREFQFWLAGEGTPYSSIDLPRIVRPADAPTPHPMNFYPQGLPQHEMEGLQEAADAFIATHASKPPDIYQSSYATSELALKECARLTAELGGNANVLRP